jgi:hypothetical protein
MLGHYKEFAYQPVVEFESTDLYDNPRRECMSIQWAEIENWDTIYDNARALIWTVYGITNEGQSIAIADCYDQDHANAIVKALAYFKEHSKAYEEARP